LTITIFASISLLYIPYNQSRDQINDQRYRNETLEYQIDRLQNYIDNQQDSQTNSSLVSAYNLIESKQDDMPIDYFLDLVDILPGTITITDYEFNVLEKSMKVTITSDDTEELINYILEVHERFKIGEDNINQNQWITIMPDTVFLTGNVCEVTIYYA
jgi:hypothetical protein